MTWQVWTIGVLAAVVLLVTTYAVVLRRRLGRPTTPSGDPRVDGLSGRPADRTPQPAVSVSEPEYVITSVGHDVEPDRRPVPDGVVLSATLGEPLVKAVALAHGVRRALSPANRNRIGFEVRQEVRRSRKVRRAEMRVAWRRMKAEERAAAQSPVQSGGRPADPEALEGLGETA